MDPIHRCTCSPCITDFSPFIDSLWSHLAWPCLPVLILLIYETGLAASSKNILCRVIIQILTYVRSAPRMEYKSSNVSILFYVPATCVGTSCESKPLIMGYAGNNLLYALILIPFQTLWNCGIDMALYYDFISYYCRPTPWSRLLYFCFQNQLVPQCREDTAIRTFCSSGIPRETVSNRWIQVWFENLCAHVILRSTETVSIQWWAAENKYRKV